MKALKLILKLLGVLVLVCLIIYIALWIPVLDKINNPCKYYPNLLRCE